MRLPAEYAATLVAALREIVEFLGRLMRGTAPDRVLAGLREGPFNSALATGMHPSNGILFDHARPIRREALGTRGITRAVAAIHPEAGGGLSQPFGF
jgi:hypothetical protein